MNAQLLYLIQKETNRNPDIPYDSLVTARGVLVVNLSGRSYLVGRIRLRMGANAQIGEN